MSMTNANAHGLYGINGRLLNLIWWYRFWIHNVDIKVLIRKRTLVGSTCTAVLQDCFAAHSCYAPNMLIVYMYLIWLLCYHNTIYRSWLEGFKKSGTGRTRDSNLFPRSTGSCLLFLLLVLPCLALPMSFYCDNYLVRCY